LPVDDARLAAVRLAVPLGFDGRQRENRSLSQVGRNRLAGVGTDPSRVVRDGYDLIARSYLAARPGNGGDMAVLTELTQRLPTGSAVLDAGCGAGFPLSGELIRRRFRVVGLDFSAGQLELARTCARSVELVQADMAQLPFGGDSFDAVVSYYAIIHVPRSSHADVFSEFSRVVRHGGLALLCLGWADNPADHDSDSWLGVPMFWSHFNAGTNLGLLEEAGFMIEWSQEIGDPMHHASHLFVLAKRR
jgi:SAM-dependent methyltransferase